MVSRLAIAAAVGAAAGALACWSLVAPRRPAQRAGVERADEEVSAAARAILGGAAPSVSFRRVSENFVAEYDSATRNPRWVVERLAPGGGGSASRARHVFKEDPGVPPQFRARLADYEHSGFDRGHLAPAADNHSSDAAMHDSFLLTNVSPQVGAGFNRDYWARLEKFVRGLAGALPGGETFVATGPLFVPQLQRAGERAHAQFEYRHQALGDPLHWVQVPTHFFKVIIVTGSDGRAAAAGAFVLPNARIAADKPLADFAVPIAAVEAASGLRFFSDLIDEQARGAADKNHFLNAARVLLPGLAAPAAAAAALRLPEASAGTSKPRLRHLCSAVSCELPGGFIDGKGAG
jgi:hypothetical protein